MPLRQLIRSQLIRMQDHWPGMPGTDGVIDDYAHDPFVSQLSDREFVAAISHLISEWKGFTHPHIGDVKDAARLLAKRTFVGVPDFVDDRKCLACDTTTLVERDGRLEPDHKAGCRARDLHPPLTVSPRRGGLGSLSEAIAAERAAREHAHAE